MSEQRERRKRKWDIQGDPNNIPPEIQNTIAADTVAAASAAAARINAMMVAQGIAGTKLQQPVTRDININDCRPDLRYQLTKGQTHEQILKDTGCTIVTKGRYKPPTDTSFESPLYLQLMAETAESLERGFERINSIMNQATGYSAKVMVGLDPLTEPRFPLVGKLLGQKGAFVKHIANETHSRVQLKGKGSGYMEGNTQAESNEPLYLHIVGTSQKGVDDAKALAENLVSHVKQEYAEFQKAKALHVPPPPPVQGAYKHPPQYPQQYAQQYPGVYNPYAYHQAYAAYPQAYPYYANQGAYAAYAQPPGTQPVQPPTNQYPPPSSYENSSSSSSSDSISPPGTTTPSYPPSYPQPYKQQQQQQQPLRGSDRFDPRNPRFDPQDYQPQVAEEPVPKRRFQEKKEAPAVGPQMATQEEMDAYALPEPSDLMPPGSSEDYSKNKGAKLVDYDEQNNREYDNTEEEPTGGLTDYATAYNLKKQKQQQQQPSQLQQTSYNNNTNNNSINKPAAPARPFWALGPESIPNTNDKEKPKKSGRDSRSDGDYDDVLNHLGIKGNKH